MTEGPVTVPEWISIGFLSASQNLQKEDVMPNALARSRVAQALATREEPEQDNKKIIFFLEDGVEHLLVLQKQARLSGLPMDVNTLTIEGPDQSVFVVVNRAQFALNKKPTPVKKGGPDAALLSEQITRLNLEIAA